MRSNWPDDDSLAIQMLVALHGVFNCSPQIAVEAEDVCAERLRVEALPAGEGSASIIIYDLHKTFPKAGGKGSRWAGCVQLVVERSRLGFQRGQEGLAQASVNS